MVSNDLIFRRRTRSAFVKKEGATKKSRESLKLKGRNELRRKLNWKSSGESRKKYDRSKLRRRDDWKRNRDR